jgi:hypothetical protein
MNRQNVAKWCREFEAGRSDVHDGRPSVVTDGIIQKLMRTFMLTDVQPSMNFFRR